MEFRFPSNNKVQTLTAYSSGFRWSSLHPTSLLDSEGILQLDPRHHALSAPSLVNIEDSVQCTDEVFYFSAAYERVYGAKLKASAS
ncbi:hypothetical protein C5167_045091 [Papaver somniferum]|uniref:Uncharacterized protein n=1 Tax=Papaver somniferum TaxID=3469 RepID=A0A4Y7LBC2_PAPSO|nr:hypothetical protein C5167_045091 [Papaver somniferum]